MTNLKFGRLTGVQRVGRQGSYATWLFRCECGNETVARSHNVRHGNTRSCGCLHRESIARNGASTKRHGMRGTPTYRSWKAMHERCRNVNSTSYRYYGARGIAACERWLSFENFLSDMGERPAGRTLDRRDNDRAYEPSNCRWSTPAEQASNRRSRNQYTGRA